MTEINALTPETPNTASPATHEVPPATTTAPPALVADEISRDGLLARGFSRRGAAHRLVGEPRQDAFGWRIEDHLAVFVVADGVGSIPTSHLGAQAAVDATLALLDDPALDLNDPAGILERICESMRDHGHRLGLTSDDLSCTWTAALIPTADPETGTRTAHLLTIGDAEALTSHNGTWISLTADLDQTATNVITHCLPGNPGSPHTRAIDLTTDFPLVLASDGFADALRKDRSGSSYPDPAYAGRIAADLAQRWAGTRTLQQYCADLGFDIHHDDFTALTIWTTPTD